MKQMLNRGFTLIELLVVIAIIGILASVVLASLNTARDKGADAAIKSSINNARAEAELHYDDSGNTYAGLCTALAETAAAVNSTGGPNSYACEDGPNGYTLTGELSNAGTDPDHYCVDSSGNAEETNGPVVPATAGNWASGTDDCASL